MDQITGHVNVINNSYKWTIHNFSKYNTSSTESIKSPIFAFERHNVRFEWQLSLYPLGSHFVYLHICSHNKQEIKLNVKLSFLNILNEEIQQCTNSFTFTKKKSKFETNLYVEKNEVANEQSGVFKCDILTIMCELTSDHCSWNQGIESTILSKRDEQLDCLEKLLDNKKFSDVEIVLDEGRTLHAHKNLLACKSSTFASMFGAEENKKHCRITIKDVDYDACKEMLRFIYVGKVKDLEVVAHQLATLADRYSITGLKNVCEAFLCNNIALDNVIDNLNLADECNMSILKENVLAFIAKNRKLIIKEPAFKTLGYTLPTELIFELLCAIVNADE